MSEMSFYKCGHDGEPVFLNNNPLSYAAYCDWKGSVGFDGSKELCWNCFNLKKKDEYAQV
jgi:hypothetical protein